MRLAIILGITEEAVVGHLVRFWGWVDANLSLDSSPEMSRSCPVLSGTKTGLDRVAAREGFVDAMVTVGWLIDDSGKIAIPNYEHHLSKSAKTRALETRKKQRFRAKKNAFVPDVSTDASPKMSRSHRDKKGDDSGTETVTREEKRREEDKYNKPLTPLPFSSPNFAAAWERWKVYRSEIRKPLKPSTIKQQFADFAAWGEADSIEAIDTAIRNGWQGVFRPKDNHGKDSKRDCTSGAIEAPSGKFAHLTPEATEAKREARRSAESPDPVSPDHANGDPF